MPTEGRILSRENVQSWLFQSGSKLQTKVTPAPTICSNSTDREPIRAQAQKSRGARQQTRTRPDSPSQSAGYNSQSFRVGHHRNEGTEAGGRYQEQEITDRLRLQGPFRAVDHDAGKSHPPRHLSQKAQDRPKKNYASRITNKFTHRHKKLSVSSNLQPTRTTELKSVLGPEDGPESISVTTKSCRRGSTRRTDRFSARIGSLILPSSSPKQLRPTYERRKRHRTRADRYDVNNMPKRKRQTPEEPSGDKKPTKKRKHSEKSGRALITDFTAPNVAPERLTLKPGNRIGLFSRGKASVPIRRRGVADLAFSELAFLNTDRKKPDQGPKGHNKEEAGKTKKTRKDADREAEISRYFTANKARHQDNTGESDDRRWYQAPNLSRHKGSPSPIVESPQRAFLGFGTSGANSVSPVKIVKELDARYVPPMSQRDTISPTRSTSYLTWSQTSAPSVPRGRTECSITRMPPLVSHPRVSNSGSQSMLGKLAISPDNGCAHEDQCEGSSKAPSAPVPSHPSIRSGNMVSKSPPGRRQLPGSPSYANVTLPNKITLMAPEIISNLTNQADSPGPTTALLPQSLANQKVYDSIHATANALLQACTAKLSESTTAKLDHAPQSRGDRPPSKHSQHLPQAKQVPCDVKPDRLTLLQTDSERESRSSQPIPLSNPRKAFSRDSCTDNKHAEILAPSSNSPNLDVQPISYRPQTKNSMYPRAVCSAFPSAFRKALNNYDTISDRQEDDQLQLTNVLEDCADKVENDYRARNDNKISLHEHLHGEQINFMHSYASSTGEIGGFDLDQGHPEHKIQDALPRYQQDRRNVTSIDPEAEIYLPKDTPRRKSEGHRFQIADPTPHPVSFYEPQNFWMLKDAHYLKFDVIDRVQSSKAYGETVEQSLATHTPPSISAREQNTQDFLSRSRGREVVDSLPADFWKPNRLY